ncbi:MAG: RNA methyltransferase [Clostridia bacterium]|nr:RNA methyltransferase [Clostridia bacterium]
MEHLQCFRSCGEVITSRQNPFVKTVCALSEKKQREKYGLFRFDGCKLLEEALKTNVPITAIAVRESSLSRIDAWLWERLGDCDLSAKFDVRILADGVFEKISEEKSPDGVICVAKALDKFHKITTINNIPEILRETNGAGKALFLCEVRDPGNVGTILRTAAAFGIDTVFLSRDCADLYQPRTLRAAMGAIFRLPTVRIAGDTASAISALRAEGRTVYATALDDSARPLGSFALKREDVFVIGNEGHGLSEAVIAGCDSTVYIPMAPGSESLNAAMAATVCAWEMRNA